MTLDELIADDRAWFSEHPDAEYRVRDATPIEHAPIRGLRILTVVYPDEIDRPDLREFVSMPIVFPAEYKRAIFADTIQQILRMRLR